MTEDRENKIRVNIFFDQDVLNELRQIKKETGLPVSGFVNQVMRAVVDNRDNKQSLNNFVEDNLSQWLDKFLDRIPDQELKNLGSKESLIREIMEQVGK